MLIIGCVRVVFGEVSVFVARSMIVNFFVVRIQLFWFRIRVFVISIFLDL